MDTQNNAPYQNNPEPQAQTPPTFQPLPQQQYAPQPQSMNSWQPIPAVNPPTQSATQTDKPKHPLTLPLVAAAVALVVGVGIGSISVLSLRKTTPKAAPVATKEQPPTPLTAGMTIEYMRGFFSGTDAAKTSLSTTVSTPNRPYSTVVSDPKAVAKISLAGMVAAKNASATLSSLRSAMTTQRYAETVLSDGVGGTNFLADYTRSETICQIVADKTQDPSASHYIEVKCLDKKQYEDLASIQEPFYKAYHAASATSASTVMIGAATITPSATAGYQLAEQQTATAVTPHKTTAGPTVKFYAAADTIWHYFTDSSSILNCSTYYKQPATTAAYVGTPCQNDKNQTVKVQAKKS